MVMASRIPKGGRVLSVSIYPSEFGLKCINIDTTQGPSALIGADDGGEDNNNDYEEDSGLFVFYRDLDSETENKKLCTYELHKLRLATKHKITLSDYHLE